MRVYFTNLGCKLNQAELERLSRQFHAAGHEVVGDLADADLHVVNSCTVTHRAARDSRKTARRAARLSDRWQAEGDGGDRIRTVLTGCYATGSAEEAAALAGVDLVVTNDRKNDLLDLVHETFPEHVPDRPRSRTTEAGLSDHRSAANGAEGVPVPYVPIDFGNTRALLKIEDGCNMRCSFCIIPFTRGRQTSRALPEVVDEMRSLVAAGFREVVVTGVQISAYRWQHKRLADVVAAFLDETGIERLRLTSIAPWQLDERLIELWSDPRICRHLHMSLQSGCDQTLERMRRPYTSERYREVVESVRGVVPGLAVTTDVIVGFPGETEEEFEASLRFVESMNFAKTHVFSYSSREGTLAADLPDHLPPDVIKRRTRRMIEAAERSERRFVASHRDLELSVLWEFQRAGEWVGMTDNYLRAVMPARVEEPLRTEVPTSLALPSTGGKESDLQGRETLCKVVSIADDGLSVQVDVATA